MRYVYFIPGMLVAYIYIHQEGTMDKPADHDPDFLSLDPFPPESEETGSMDLGYPLNEIEAERLVSQIQGSLPEDWA